jgi:hypothetical protein
VVVVVVGSLVAVVPADALPLVEVAEVAEVVVVVVP